jgi:hypothetical protein
MAMMGGFKQVYKDSLSRAPGVLGGPRLLDPNGRNGSTAALLMFVTSLLQGAAGSL